MEEGKKGESEGNSKRENGKNKREDNIVDTNICFYLAGICHQRRNRRMEKVGRNP